MVLLVLPNLDIMRQMMTMVFLEDMMVDIGNYQRLK
jgi:hypothetical protein